MQPMRRLKFSGQIIAHTMAAILGTTLIVGPIAKLVRPDTGGGIILREWICSILFAGLLGCLLGGYRKSDAANWAWIIPGAIFLVRALIYVVTWRTAFFRRSPATNAPSAFRSMTAWISSILAFH